MSVFSLFNAKFSHIVELISEKKLSSLASLTMTGGGEHGGVGGGGCNVGGEACCSVGGGSGCSGGGLGAAASPLHVGMGGGGACWRKFKKKKKKRMHAPIRFEREKLEAYQGPETPGFSHSF